MSQAMIEATKIPNLPNNDPVKERRARQSHHFTMHSASLKGIFFVALCEGIFIFVFLDMLYLFERCFKTSEEYMMAASERICVANLYREWSVKI